MGGSSIRKTTGRNPEKCVLIHEMHQMDKKEEKKEPQKLRENILML